MRALQAEFGTRLRVLGSIGDVRDVLAAADLLVLTSRTEGIPGAVIEAGLSGVGTVATSVGGVPNVVDDARTGRLVPLDRPSELAAAITDALEHRVAYGRAAHDKCRAEYSMEAVGAAWEHLIDTLVPPETGPARGAPDAQLQTVGTVLHVVASTQRRGAEVFADQLGQALGARGWGQQTVAVTASKGESRLPFPVLGHGRFSLTTLLRLGRLARSSDVLVAHGSNSLLPVMIVAGVTGRPYAYRNIGDPEYWGHVSYANWRVGSPLRRARTVVALSAPAKEWIALPLRRRPGPHRRHSECGRRLGVSLCHIGRQDPRHANGSASNRAPTYSDTWDHSPPRSDPIGRSGRPPPDRVPSSSSVATG